MPAKPDFTPRDLGVLLERIRSSILVLRYDNDGKAVYGCRDLTSPTGYRELGPLGTFDPFSINGTNGLPVFLGICDPADLHPLQDLFGALTRNGGSIGL